jgi:hypothetical protein
MSGPLNALDNMGPYSLFPQGTIPEHDQGPPEIGIDEITIGRKIGGGAFFVFVAFSLRFRQ